MGMAFTARPLLFSWQEERVLRLWLNSLDPGRLHVGSLFDREVATGWPLLLVRGRRRRRGRCAWWWCALDGPRCTMPFLAP